MNEFLLNSSSVFVATVRDVLPIIIIIVGFRLFVLRKKVSNPKRLIAGFAYVIVGLVMFLIGLEEALFPLGRQMAQQLTAPEFLGDVSHWSQ
ncbi:MAG: DUF1538 family protein, partial [Gammaproteobacteria bacterium]|nr:DUF1538 family protein [Gammaproteobacteria bacterium]